MISKSPCTCLQTVLQNDPKMSDLFKDVLDNCMKKLHSSETDQVGNTDFTASNVENICTEVESKNMETDKNVLNGDVQQV